MREYTRQKMLDLCLGNPLLLIGDDLSKLQNRMKYVEDYIAAQNTPNTKAIKKIILDLIQTQMPDVHAIGIILKKLLMVSEIGCIDGNTESYYPLRFFLQDEFLDVIGKIISNPSGELKEKMKEIFIAKKILKPKYLDLLYKVKNFFSAPKPVFLDIDQITDYKNIAFTESEFDVLNNFFKTQDPMLSEIWKEGQHLESLWRLSNAMTAHMPAHRPTLEQVVESLQSDFFARTPSTTPGQSGECSRSDSVLTS